MLGFLLYAADAVGDVVDFFAVFDVEVSGEFVSHSGGVDEVYGFVGFGHLVEVVAVFDLAGRFVGWD